MGRKYQQVTYQLDSRTGLLACLAAAPVLVFLAVYLPPAGQGFVRDDFAWILHSRLNGPYDLIRLFGTDLGFYRPFVGLTFALDGWLSGSAAGGYGVTNVLLALACAGALGWLARSAGLPAGGAALAGGLWLLQADFMPIGVLWISGRTALVMILAATASAALLMRGRPWASLACLAAALLSKEEAVVLPFVLVGWLWITPSPPVRPAAWAMAAGALEAVYFVVRAIAGATTVATAPAYYQFTFDPATVVANLMWYVVHAGWLAAIVAGAAIVVLPGSGSGDVERRIPEFQVSRVLRFTALWVGGSLALTIWLPMRSHLYLAMPAIGACLAAAAVCTRAWMSSTPGRRRLGLAAAAAIVVMLVPIHIRGARDWAARTAFAGTVLRDLHGLTDGLPPGSSVILIDNRDDPHGNLATVFGTMAREAGTVATGHDLDVWIDPPPPHAAEMGLGSRCRECAPLRLSLVEGRLRLSPSQ
jgi:hypothetical protein